MPSMEGTETGRTKFYRRRPVTPAIIKAKLSSSEKWQVYCEVVMLCKREDEREGSGWRYKNETWHRKKEEHHNSRPTHTRNQMEGRIGRIYLPSNTLVLEGMCVATSCRLSEEKSSGINAWRPTAGRKRKKIPSSPLSSSKQQWSLMYPCIPPGCMISMMNFSASK